MGKERSDADKRNAERRAQAEEMQRKVSPSPFVTALSSLPSRFRPVLALRAGAIVIFHNVTPLNLPSFFSQMADHLKNSKASLQRLLEEYWALRKRTSECLIKQNGKEH